VVKPSGERCVQAWLTGECGARGRRPLSKRKAWKMTDILVKEHVYDPAAAAADSAALLRARDEARAAWAAALARLPRTGGRRRAKRFPAQGFAAGGAPPEAGGAAGAGERP